MSTVTMSEECLCRHRDGRHVTLADLGDDTPCLECACPQFRALAYFAVICQKCGERPARPSGVDVDQCWKCWGDKEDSGRVIFNGSRRAT